MQATRSCLAGAALAAAVLAPAGSAHAQLYGRLDTGISWAADAGIRDSIFICGNAACTVPGELGDVGQSAIVQAGAGWRINPNLRADLTVGYRGWYELDDTDGLQKNFRADIKSWSVLANGYWDFTSAAFRPYVGAGVGWARNEIDPVTWNLVGLPLTVTAPGGSKSDFAWALMVGVAWRTGPRLTLDVGYRYVDLGKIRSSAGDMTLIAPIAIPISGFEGHLRAHELTVGLRF